MFSDEELGKRIREARTSASLTQRQVGLLMTAAGYPLHQTAIGKIEMGDRTLSIGETVAMCQIVGLSMQAVFDVASRTTAADFELAAARTELAISDMTLASAQAALRDARANLAAAKADRAEHAREVAALEAKANHARAEQAARAINEERTTTNP